MSTPIVFAPPHKDRRSNSLFGGAGGDDADDLLSPNNIFSEFPAAARRALPKEARDMMGESSSGLPSALRRLVAGNPGEDCGGCGAIRCRFCHPKMYTGGNGGNGGNGGLVRLDLGLTAVSTPSVFRSPSVSNAGPAPGLTRSMRFPGAGSPHPSAAEYLARKSQDPSLVHSPHPLLVLSLDGLLDARLPYHLTGGWTDVLTRPYLLTFMEYVVRPESDWILCFYTELDRETALRTMRQLRLPTGGPEVDERDNVVGLWTREDMIATRGGPGLDLQVLWAGLAEEENILWGPKNTVVITDDPSHCKLQPKNFVLGPQMSYISSQNAKSDNFLLALIGILEELLPVEDIPSCIRMRKWNKPDLWTSQAQDAIHERNQYTVDGLEQCALLRITVRALTGNLYK